MCTLSELMSWTPARFLALVPYKLLFIIFHFETVFINLLQRCCFCNYYVYLYLKIKDMERVLN